MERKTCVLCNKKSLESHFIFSDFCSSYVPTYNSPSSDTLVDLEWKRCISCGSIQLTTLVDPVILYSSNHNNTFNSLTWNKHHTEFCEFIASKIGNSQKLLEIGGASYCLLRRMLEKGYSNYSILDMAEASPELQKEFPDISYIRGNCEDFIFPEVDTIVISHVFEHLYNPRKFLECLEKSSIQSIFISIPNLEALYRSQCKSILHIEHTYSYSESDIEALFSEFSFTCASKQLFGNHSLFYHFTKSEPKSLEYSNSLVLMNHFQERKALIEAISIEMPCFIAPAGHFGHILYYHLSPTSKKNILGFLDNDVTKQKKRMQGTPCTIFSPSILEDYKETIQILLFGGLYNDEIKKQFLFYTPFIEFIEL
jgi:hypothetical protein